MASDNEEDYDINGDQEDDNQDPHFPKFFNLVYIPNKENLKMSVQSIMMKRKRDRKSIDRILFKQNYQFQTFQEQKEVERDRSDYIQFVLKKFKNQIPEELKDIQKDKLTKKIKKGKDLQKYKKTNEQISQQIMDIFEGANNKPGDKKNQDKKDKNLKKDKTESDNDDNNNDLAEHNEYEDMSYNELYNKSDDEIYQSGGGNDDQYDYE